MPNTSKGYPYPSGSDDVDVPGDIQALAAAVDLTPGIRSYTSTQIAALAAGDKWAGRVVWNSTTSKLQVSNGSTFSDVDTTATLSSATPQALGTAAAGTSSDASRADHVHAMPTANQVGAAPTSLTISAGNGLTGGGDLTANRTLSANFSASAAALGSSSAGAANTVSRGDHVHAMPTATDVGAIASTIVDAKGDIVAASADNTPARLAVGTNGFQLVADSTQTTGLRWAAEPVTIAVAISDETTNITTGTAKVTFRMPFAMTVTAVRASLSTASSSGLPTFDINEGGTSILGANKLSIDANEKTSTTAATATTIADSALADDAEITIDVDVAGTGARGAKVYLIGTRA